MDSFQFNAHIEHIVKALKEAGYNPYEQLMGYVTTGEENYITRHGDARLIIKTLDKQQIRLYLQQMKK